MANSNTFPLHRSQRLQVDGSTGTLRSRHYTVTVVCGPEAEKCVALDGTILVGTHPDCTIALTDPSVSRYHLELQETAGGVKVRDLSSSNGTFLGDVRVEAALIEAGATLTIGRTALRIALKDEDLGQLPTTRTSLGRAVGETVQMRRLFELGARAARSDAPVLLLGETGTGKELIAEAIHRESDRKDHPFVVVDCGSIPPGLIESELFGHVKGAFTDARTDRLGAFLEANHGTIFLDEIGELPKEQQPRLLRALDAGMVKRVGEDKHRKVDVRLIAATHRNLVEEMNAGRFRQDLYFRMAIVVAWLPPLRERTEDIPLLVQHFVQQLGRGDFELPESLYEKLRAHSWPGNVRELRNVVLRALSGVEQDPLAAATAPPPREAAPKSVDELAELQFKDAKDKLVETFTRDYLAVLLKRFGGNVSAVARAAGLNRNYVHRLVTRYGLKTSE